MNLECTQKTFSLNVFIFKSEKFHIHSLFIIQLIITGSNQPVGGKHTQDSSQLTQEQLHPGMNPDPAERGRQLGHENAQGGQSVGTGGHGPRGANLDK